MDGVKNVIDYLRVVVEMGGSDLHLSSGAPPAARIDGVIKPLEEFCLDEETARHAAPNAQDFDRLLRGIK